MPADGRGVEDVAEIDREDREHDQPGRHAALEQLDADLRVLLRNLGLPQSWAEIPNTNPTRERLDASIARYYNRVSFRLVLNAYYGSFERFGYPTRYNAYRA